MVLFAVDIERDAWPFREGPALSSALMSDLAREKAGDLMGSRVIVALRSPSFLVRMSRTYSSCSSMSIEIHMTVWNIVSESTKNARQNGSIQERAD